MHIVLDRLPDGLVVATMLSGDTQVESLQRLTRATFPEFVRERERQHPRWVWDDTAGWYPSLLNVGVRIERAHDLRLGHAILRASEFAAGSAFQGASHSAWDEPGESARPAGESTLFELDTEPRHGAADAVTEWRAQQDAISGSPQASRLRLLLAAESAGALAAAEMRHTGLPWRADVHDAVLAEALGPRPVPGARPAQLEGLAGEIRDALGAPTLNPDSAVELLRALKATGLPVTTTRSWELKQLDHPVIAPLLAYKKGSRLLTANGWSWLDAWVKDGRFRPDYVVGGVVSGRWATSGGGALQLPKQVRAAVVADPGWKLVVADAAQLEPRVLAGLGQDTAMAAAGRGSDLYEGLVASGAVDERQQAKQAMLGAMYGATTGDSARLMPRLARAFPRAIGVVERAARQGERGEIVTSLLGRSSPRPAGSWPEVQERASRPDASAADERRARSQAREWGRFTRNFVVQATAAEWALCWLAQLRNRLYALSDGTVEQRPHLVYFLHDEIIVHAPAELADQTTTAVIESAASAGRLLFGDFPVDFPVTAEIVDSYGEVS